jgi:FkbM family methyltransferase
MADGPKKLLKRWRDNYYLSSLLAHSLKPLQVVFSQTVRGLQQKVRKNGVTIRLPNGKNLSIGRDSGIGIASLLFWHGLDGHEPETSRTLRFLFERASTFVDVGANCGLYSILGALWNPNLQVVAFEPVPAIFSGLERNVRLNHVENRVRCEYLALSSTSGKATLFLPESDTLDVEATGTLVSDSWQHRNGSPPLEVETVTFDEYESRNPTRVDLIKIDVEDFEADVLEGMQQTIRRDRPFIVCEVLPRLHRNQRTRKIVEALNYQPYWITPVSYVRVPGFDCSRSHFTDFLLSPVSTQDVVVDNLDVLWELKKAELKVRPS